MATKIKDSATAQKAALNLNQGVEVVDKPGEPITPREKTTSEKLFPAFMTDDGGIVNRPVRPTELSGPLPVTATPEPTPQDQKPTPQAPTNPVYLKPEELTGKMVRLKVDGVEQDVPAESLIKTNQLERHLNSELMKLAQERKLLEDDRRRLQSTPPIVDPPKPTKTEPVVKKTAEVEALEAQIFQMRGMIDGLQQTMLPVIQESGIKHVEKMVKDKIGTDDFRTYFEKIRDGALEQMAKPEVANDPNARRYFDSDAYYFETYKDLKLKELTAPKAVTPPVNLNAPVLVTPQGAPVIVNNNGQPVSIPTFESSGGVPSRQSPDANWQSTYNALFARAQESGRQEDWQALYRHKIRAQD